MFEHDFVDIQISMDIHTCRDTRALFFSNFNLERKIYSC